MCRERSTHLGTEKALDKCELVLLLLLGNHDQALEDGSAGRDSRAVQMQGCHWGSYGVCGCSRSPSAESREREGAAHPASAAVSICVIVGVPHCMDASVGRREVLLVFQKFGIYGFVLVIPNSLHPMRTF